MKRRDLLLAGTSAGLLPACGGRDDDAPPRNAFTPYFAARPGDETQGLFGALRWADW